VLATTSFGRVRSFEDGINAEGTIGGSIASVGRADVAALGLGMAEVLASVGMSNLRCFVNRDNGSYSSVCLACPLGFCMT
jgi:hypothetical protein